jgi:hypothetical protein
LSPSDKKIVEDLKKKYSIARMVTLDAQEKSVTAKDKAEAQAGKYPK